MGLTQLIILELVSFSAGAFLLEAWLLCWLCSKLMELTVPFSLQALGHCVQLEQWVSSQGDFVPWGTLGNVGDIFDCHRWGVGVGGCYWYLVGRGQRCC